MRIDDAELASALLASHGLRIASIVRKRTVQGVIAEDGTRVIWKPLTPRDDEARLNALAAMTSCYQSAGARVALPLAGIDGQSFIVRLDDGHAGYVQPWLNGRHIDVAHRGERLEVLTSLARVQRASQTQLMPMYSHLQRGTLFGKLRAKKRAIERVWDDAARVCDLLLPWKTSIFKRMEYVLRTYDRHVANPQREWRKETAFCHRDLAPHNVLYLPGDAIGWIDFDHAGYDDMLSDAMQFISHALFLAPLTDATYRELFDVYGETARLSPEQTALLYTLSLWPDVLIRTLIEWVQSGFRPDGQVKLEYALQCERKRLAYTLDASYEE